MRCHVSAAVGLQHSSDSPMHGVNSWKSEGGLPLLATPQCVVVQWGENHAGRVCSAHCALDGDHCP